MLPELLAVAVPGAPEPAALEPVAPGPMPLEVLPALEPGSEEAVEVVLDTVPETPGVVAVVVRVVGLVSLAVEDVVGVGVAVVVEPGVAEAPELLYEVLAPLLQPGRAAVATASTAT